MTHVERTTPIVKFNLKLVNGPIAITGAGADEAAKQLGERNKGVIFQNCAPFTDCISEINNTQGDNAKDLDVVLLMYNLIEYSDNYSETIWKVMAILHR